MTIAAPISAVLGDISTATLDWSGLTSGNRYLGSITYHDVFTPIYYNHALMGFTIVRINTD